MKQLAHDCLQASGDALGFFYCQKRVIEKFRGRTQVSNFLMVRVDQKDRFPFAERFELSQQQQHISKTGTSICLFCCPKDITVRNFSHCNIIDFQLID